MKRPDWKDTPLVSATDIGVSCDVATPTATWSRVGAACVALLVLSTILLACQNVALNKRLALGEQRVNDISGLLAQQARRALTRDELDSVRTQLQASLATADQRVAALEARSEAVSRIIGTTSQSIVFLQGAYGFEDAESGRPLRYVVGPHGRPIGTPRGPAVDLDGTGPVLEAQFTGTAFVATPDRLLLTNRHVARPWEENDATEFFAEKGLVPVMRRFVGYLPDSEEPFEVKFVSASDDADVAVLRSDGIPTHIPHLELSLVSPRPGDDVIVMGYPTGMRALLARADQQFVDELDGEDELDFWSVGRRLSKGSHISPLAKSGHCWPGHCGSRL